MDNAELALEDLHNYPSGVFTRLKKAPSQHQVQQYARFWVRERDMFAEHLMINMAWVTLMGEQGFVERPDAAAILGALREIEAGGADGFNYNPANGDTYFNIESTVIGKLGEEIGGKMYTGRTRVDGEPTIKRMYLRRRLLDVADLIADLADVLLNLAGDHLESVMPGYTGFQAGQPWTFGHFLLSFADAFARDHERVQGAFARMNRSLLGGAAGSGSDIPFDRVRVANLLGFDALIENSREWCTAVDCLVEAVSACAILMGHVGQICNDILTFCTQEFGMAELGDDFSSTSSFMPQKKNPNSLYNIRAAASGFASYLPGLLSVMRTSSNDFDVNKPPMTDRVLEAFDETTYNLDYLTASLATLEFHVETARDHAFNLWTAAVEIATLMVRERGVAWRTSHRVTERFMRIALESGSKPGDVTGEMLDEAAQAILGRRLELTTEQVRQALDPMQFIRTRRTQGSPNPEESARMLADRRQAWAELRGWTKAKRDQLAGARSELDRAMAAFG
jgi:argininosuccinate lyase